ncbi:uncharacterized protein LOC133113989 [Conger conger]|uniref:uncharacterized protein LOC133113989 n=1 Tax=Conger conger TaxID=82655 RepID=UPI002A59ECE9|nr:uncharacterized protein LOC133113989 [Conger conger]
MEVFLLATLFPLVSSATNSLVELRASDVVAGPCHGRVTLVCDVSEEKGITVSSLSWIHVKEKRPLCSTDHSIELKKQDRIRCRYTPQTRLALTISPLWPTDQGEYLCKLRSNLGMKNAKSQVQVQECFSGVNAVSSPSAVACHFYGVFPLGKVHWFHQGKNVTSAATSSIKEDHKGMYNVSSTLPVNEDSTAEEYNCSLWIPGAGAYRNSTLVHASQRTQRIADPNTAVSLHIFGLGSYLLLARVVMT